MQTPASPTADADQGDTDTWPWQCLDCEATIYHDGEFCLDCASSSRLAVVGGEADAPSGFLDWMRRQPVSAFVLKVSVISGLELALTAFWLRTVLQESLELASVVPGIA